jgi:hypothetical protein
MNGDLTRDIIKWGFTFFMVGVTIYWGTHVMNVFQSFQSKAALDWFDALVAFGVGGITTALLTLDTLIVQFWFRKSPRTLSK